MENPTSALLCDFIFYLLKTEGIYKQCLCMPVFFLQGGCVLQYLLYLQAQANNGSFYVLLVIMVIDVLTGVILATARKSDNTLNGRLESRQLIKGIYRKMGEILIYLLGVTISFFTNENAVAYLTIAGIIAHESLSVLENLALLNVPIPQKLKDILEVIKKGGKNGKD